MNQRGIVLITVLMFMSFISLLVVMNLADSNMQMRMNANYRLEEIGYKKG